MKKTAVAAIGAGLIGLCVVAAAFIIYWIWSQSHEIAEYLPPKPAVVGVSITATEAKVFDHFAVRSFRFTAKNAADPNEAASLFDAQLTSAGWEKTATCSTRGVSSTAWHQREKLEGGLHLTFTILQLDATGEYVGTMVTVPYWVHTSPNPTSR